MIDQAKLEAANERLAIMSETTAPNYDLILDHIAEKYGKEISDHIRLKNIAPNAKKRGIESTLGARGYKHTTQPENIAIKPDFSVLRQYIEAGIKLIPTRPTKKAFYQCKNKDGNIIKIETEQELKAWLQNDIKRFIFTPKEAGLLCIDIDKGHADGIDGLKNFEAWLKDKGLDQAPLFKDLSRFPCYTKTPSGGLHLYFSFAGNIQTSASIVPGVEIKYNGLSLTAGGSLKNGKLYSLQGSIKNAPLLPGLLSIEFSKTLKAEPPSKQKSHLRKSLKYDTKEYTTDQLLDYARQDAGGGTHNTIFYMAKRLKTAGYSEYETIKAIEATPEHLNRNDKHDTKTCIQSVYR